MSTNAQPVKRLYLLTLGVLVPHLASPRWNKPGWPWPIEVNELRAGDVSSRYDSWLTARRRANVYKSSSTQTTAQGSTPSNPTGGKRKPLPNARGSLKRRREDANYEYQAGRTSHTSCSNHSTVTHGVGYVENWELSNLISNMQDRLCKLEAGSETDIPYDSLWTPEEAAQPAKQKTFHEQSW